MPALTLYTNPQSRGRIARWMLEETGQPYQTVVLDYGTTMKAPDYLAVNPMGKVPAILATLADAFPDAGLAPPPAERGAYYRWLFFAAGPIEQAVTTKAMGITVPDDKRGMIGFGSLDLVLDTLADHLEDRDYIATDGFTAADLYVGAHLGWGMMFGTIDKRPVFEKYFGKLAERPAAIRAREIDDKLAAEMQQPS